jgi:hypothetical protein
MCFRRAPEKYIAGAALDRAAIEFTLCVMFRNQNFVSTYYFLLLQCLLPTPELFIFRM